MKIEAGCKAVIVGSKAGNNGIIVTVLGFAGEPGFDGFAAREGICWWIDCEINSAHGRLINHIGENLLRRIDDDSRQITSWDALADIYKPPLKKTAGV